MYIYMTYILPITFALKFIYAEIAFCIKYLVLDIQQK